MHGTVGTRCIPGVSTGQVPFQPLGMAAGGSDLQAHVCWLHRSRLPCRQGDFTPLRCPPGSMNVTGKRLCPELV